MAFSRDELKAIVILGVISGIIVGFRQFAKVSGSLLHIDFGTGLVSLILIIIAMIISVYIHEWGHRFVANSIGYDTNTEAYYPGQLLGLVLAVFSFGYIQFFTPNTSDLEADPRKRIHKHRKYENFKQEALIAASGIFATGALAILLHGAWITTHNQLIRAVLLGNIWLMVYSLIPFELLSLYLLRVQQRIEQLPQSDGLYLLHYSLIAYVTAAAFVLALALILAFTASVPVWVALLIGLLAGGYVWMHFFLNAN